MVVDTPAGDTPELNELSRSSVEEASLALLLNRLRLKPPTPMWWPPDKLRCTVKSKEFMKFIIDYCRNNSILSIDLTSVLIYLKISRIRIILRNFSVVRREN